MSIIDPSLKSPVWRKSDTAATANPAKTANGGPADASSVGLPPANPANPANAVDGSDANHASHRRAARAANPPHNQRVEPAKGLLKPAKISCQALVDRIRTLRADKSAEYRFRGIQHPATLKSGQRPIEQLVQILVRDGIRFSVEGGRLTRWSNSSVPVALIDEISAYEEQIAGAIGAHSICQHQCDPDLGETDSRCSCGRMATCAVYDAHQPNNERWLCEGCFDDGAPYPPAPPRRKPSYRQKPQTEIPPKPLQIIERPNETARLTWWSEPVQGWGDGWFVIHNMSSDQTVKIDIEKEELK